MVKVGNVYDLNGNIVEKVELPEHFDEEIRKDIILRVIYAIHSNARQPYGTYEDAGMEASAWTSKRRRSYRTSYGYGISRVPRSVFARISWGFIWVARVVPQAVKGRRAHPPKPEKVWEVKINKKEKRKAIRSAIAATSVPEIVLSRYTKSRKFLEKTINTFGLPLIIDGLENIKKTKELIVTLEKFQLGEFIEYVRETRRNRAGKGKRRGRRIVKARGLLIVAPVGSDLPKLSTDGVEIVNVDKLNVDVLAPGGKPGRFTIWTKKAIEDLRNLFI